jgi:hypothetical protein
VMTAIPSAYSVETLVTGLLHSCQLPVSSQGR